MNIRRILSLIVLLAVFFVYTTPEMMAGTAIIASQNPGAITLSHAVSQADLHQAVQTSQNQALEARKYVNNFLARPEITAQIRHIGIDPARVTTQVAMLSDSELLYLRDQIMSQELQGATAGGLTKAGKIMTVIGLACVAAGVIMIAVGPKDQQIGNSNVAIDWRTTGAIWAGAGGALTIIGLTRRK